MELLKALFIKAILTITVLLYCGDFSLLTAQGNCLQYAEGSGERKACELCYTNEYKQGSKESQMLFDSAIAIGPKFA